MLQCSTPGKGWAGAHDYGFRSKWSRLLLLLTVPINVNPEIV